MGSQCGRSPHRPRAPARAPGPRILLANWPDRDPTRPINASACFLQLRVGSMVNRPAGLVATLWLGFKAVKPFVAKHLERRLIAIESNDLVIGGFNALQPFRLVSFPRIITPSRVGGEGDRAHDVPSCGVLVHLVY